MESLIEDIHSKRTLNSVREIKDIILKCATGIKSNDAKFDITTLEEVTPKLDNLMTSYVDSIQKLETSGRATLQVHEQFEELLKQAEANDDEDNSDPNAGLENLPAWQNKFDDFIEQDDIVTDQIDAQVDLDKILRPQQPRPSRPARQSRQSRQNEDIVVETQKEIPKDPITRLPIKIAVKCKRCNHVYDKISIEGYFELKEKTKAKVRCPVAGCRVKDMKRNELIDDEDTNRLINDAN